MVLAEMSLFNYFAVDCEKFERPYTQFLINFTLHAVSANQVSAFNVVL